MKKLSLALIGILIPSVCLAQSREDLGTPNQLYNKLIDITVSTIMHQQVCPYLRERASALLAFGQVVDNDKGCVLSVQSGVFTPSARFYVGDIKIKSCDKNVSCRYTYTVFCHGNSIAGAEACAEVGSGLTRDAIAYFENNQPVKLTTP